jgi:ribonucleoside-diphosphate reductase beta chain
LVSRTRGALTAVGALVIGLALPFALAACGDDASSPAAAPTATTAVEPPSTSPPPATATAPADTAPAQTTPPTTSTPSTTSPESAPGGAGDEEAARVPVTFTFGHDGVTPATVAVPAFLALELVGVSKDGEAHEVNFRGTLVQVPAGGRASVKLEGLRKGRYEVGLDGTDRADFRATSDPALHESAERANFQLLSYRELYELWERQHWAVQDIDFTQDRIDWHERISAEERYARMYGLSSFFVGEQRVAAELGPIMRAIPDEEARLFLCTQIADEARHVAFFDRFYREVGVLESDNLQERLAETSEHLNDGFGKVFDELLHVRVDRIAREPEDLETLVETITIYHMIVEGMLALTGQHFITDYNEQQGTLPGFVDGFTKVARDEHRHVAFGARFLRDMAQSDERYRTAIERTLVEVGPHAEAVLKPKWAEGEDEDTELFGASIAETRAFALQALSRRLKVIGLG